ncbi:transcription accessory protein [Pseudomonas sp. StFLB209]|nr:transcription accessory protein [Pseudomonas sp. StFLB209]
MLQQAQALFAIGAVYHLEPLIAQVQADQLGDVFVVFHHQHAFDLLHCASPSGIDSLVILTQRCPCSYHELFNSA